MVKNFSGFSVDSNSVACVLDGVLDEVSAKAAALVDAKDVDFAWKYANL